MPATSQIPDALNERCSAVEYASVTISELDVKGRAFHMHDHAPIKRSSFEFIVGEAKSCKNGYNLCVSLQ